MLFNIRVNLDLTNVEVIYRDFQQMIVVLINDEEFIFEISITRIVDIQNLNHIIIFISVIVHLKIQYSLLIILTLFSFGFKTSANNSSFFIIIHLTYVEVLIFLIYTW